MSKDPFDIFKEGLQDYHPTEVPSWLSWEENAEGIQAALVQEKRSGENLSGCSCASYSWDLWA